MIPSDGLHVSAGPHTPSQGDTSDPDIELVYQMPNRQPISLSYGTDVLHFSAGPHTPGQGDPGDPDPAVRCGAGHHLCPLRHTGQGPGGHHSALQ